ncbi:hypothetical protein [Novosphingobium malaysiense]|uniref:hypothetical protein n=1 Tax=Novosphingobium malaysiense TaxID=1348853 RepID=UPI000ADE2331|nr:hypothetical protein [Novosphingobium malaysiense]
MTNPLQIAFFLLLALAVPVAVWKGGTPERFGAAAILFMWGLQSVGDRILPSGWTSVDTFSFLSDVTGFLAFGYLALEARRIWPLWATSLQILSLSAHFARWADITIHPMVYAVMRGAPTFGALIAILLGVLFHLRRLRRDGSDPAWQIWCRFAAGSNR